MSLVDTAKQTVEIIDRGEYQSPSGATVRLRESIDATIRGTRLYRPDDLPRLSLADDATAPSRPMHIEVTDETTGAAARRLVEVERREGVVALNFASARNPGGGFLRGAKAQEEDLARCSALYASLVTQRELYDTNRALDSMLYTDHIIYSPAVPFFRDERLDLLERPFAVGVITSPAPNAGEALKRDPDAASSIHATLEARAGHVLAVARAHGHRVLLLGAWGCGVFRNEPREVADVYARWLDHPRFAGAFDHVTFAVYDASESRENLRAFEARFARRS